MSSRALAVALMGAAVITSVAACQTPSTPAVTTTPSSTAPSSTTPSSSAPPSATPTSIALTRQPCDLLTPEVAKKYAGDDAQRQLTYESNPPVPVGDNACYYTGSNRSVSVEVFPVPTDPTAPVNHFHVIRPENRVEGVDYEAYWFAAGGSLVAVKDGLLISVNVSNKGAAQTEQDRADDIELANLVVPQVG
jgi:hypothetical protein